MVSDAVVKATQRSPRTSCATRNSRVESTPPEKQTRAEPRSASRSRNRRYLASRAGASAVASAGRPAVGPEVFEPGVVMLLLIGVGVLYYGDDGGTTPVSGVDGLRG